MIATRPTPLALLLLSLAAFPGARADAEEASGRPWTGGLGTPRTVAGIIGMQGGVQGPAAAVPHVPERAKAWPDRRSLPQAPGVVDAARWPPAVAGLEAAAPALDEIAAGPQTVALSFTGATLAGVNPTFTFPADAMGAVGPTQYLLFVNGRLVSFDKVTGLADGVLNAEPDVFFAGVNDGSGTTDPRVRYDRLSGRWFLVIVSTATPNRVLLAVSDAASHGVITPATVFTQFFFSIDAPPPAISPTCFAADPTLGIDASALYIGTTNFCGPSQAFDSCDGFVVRKSSVLGAGPIVVTALRGLVASPASDGPVVPQGVDNYDPAATEGYFIGVSNTLFGRLVLRRVGTAGGTPTVSANVGITVPATSFPLLVPHLGNTGGAAGNLSATNDRLFAAHLRNGSLWTAHNIGVNNAGTTAGTRTRNGSRWYELTGIASPGTPSLVQSGTVFAPSAGNTADQPHYWFPSLMVSGQGHALMGMSTAGANARIDAATTGRLQGDPPGTMGAPSAYTASTTAYNPPGDPGGSGGRRWGDYSYTALDPIDDMTMWTIQMFCDATNSYGCRVAKVLAPLPAAPASADDVHAGETSALTTVVGVSIGGSGFYDPGADLGGGVPAFSHITATVTNAGASGTPPTVNGVIYIDPTHVQLDLNTTDATPSEPGEKYTVTITNPDGQVATGSMILGVTTPVGVGEGPPPGVTLGPVRPNPTTGPAEIEFTVERETRVRVTVVDLAGREVATLADGARPPGTHHAAWNGSAGRLRSPAGVYFVRFETEGRTLVRRFVVLD
ncbi:MAG: T9SS type A sorting domain-containing protein [Candidatus Eiseniibacteriota bacterium]